MLMTTGIDTQIWLALAIREIIVALLTATAMLSEEVLPKTCDADHLPEMYPDVMITL